MSIEIPDVIETARLVIRGPRVDDSDRVNEAIRESFDELHRWMPWAKTVPTPQETRENLVRAVERFVSREDLRLLIFRKDTGSLVGFSGLHRIDWNVPKFEIGYWQRTSCCGNGYLTEAVAAISELAFRQLKARRVEIRVDPRNERSVRIAERLGFGLEGTYRHDERDGEGRLRDMSVYAKIASD